jgi:hypothetical protein
MISLKHIKKDGSMKSFAMILTLVVFCLFCKKGNGQQVAASNLKQDEFITSWLLCGPIHLQKIEDVIEAWNLHFPGYETDYLGQAGGEQHLKVKNGELLKYGKVNLRWKYYQSHEPVINLDLAVSKEEPVLAYAYTEVNAPKDEVLFAAFGTNDGGRLWINGKQIWDHPQKRGVKTDDEMLPVLLHKGKNTILLKVEEKSGSWGFCFRFLPFPVSRLQGSGEPFRMLPLDDGSVKIATQYSDEILSNLISKATFKIVDNKGVEIVNQVFTNNYLRQIPLPAHQFSSYTAQVEMVFKNGEHQNQTIYFNAGKRIEYELFSNAASEYCIALDRQASESEQFGARELQHWIKESSGADIAIIYLDQAPEGKRIVVGFNSLLKEKTGIKEPAANDESFTYLNDGSDIFIYGGKMRGSMYGVFSFLERELGCRWYSAKVSYVPRHSRYIFDQLYHTEKPGIPVRTTDYYGTQDSLWYVRNRMNGGLGYRKQQGGMEAFWGGHTLYPLVPPNEFYDQHPEYFSLVDGKRLRENGQLCLTNPDVLGVVVDRIMKRMRENPEYAVYDVSQNDWQGYCECDKCEALRKKEGGESGIFIWFVNQVAEAIEHDFPTKYIGTFAYGITRKPPKIIHPRKNVVVRLCDIECCFSHDLKSCPTNSSFLEDMKQWSAIAPNLYYWDYVVDFVNYQCPFPNFYALQPNIKTFQQNKAICVFEEGNPFSLGEFSELRSYVITRLLWNPDANFDEVVNDFIYGYYGKAGQYVREYFDYLHQQVKPDTHMTIALKTDDPLFTNEFILKSQEIFVKAEKNAENDEMLRRIEFASLPVLYLKCCNMPYEAFHDGSYDKFNRIGIREKIAQFGVDRDPFGKEFHKRMEDAVKEVQRQQKLKL